MSHHEIDSSRPLPLKRIFFLLGVVTAITFLWGSTIYFQLFPEQKELLKNQAEQTATTAAKKTQVGIKSVKKKLPDYYETAEKAQKHVETIATEHLQNAKILAESKISALKPRIKKALPDKTYYQNKVQQMWDRFRLWLRIIVVPVLDFVHPAQRLEEDIKE